MGQLRLYEGAFTQAGELYRRAIDFEDIPDVHMDLAIAFLRANRLDEALFGNSLRGHTIGQPQVIFPSMDEKKPAAGT